MKDIKRLASYIRYAKKSFLAGNLLLVLSVIFAILLPKIGQYIIDDLILPFVEKEAQAGSFWEQFPFSLFEKALLAYLLLSIVGAFFSYFSSILFAKSANTSTQYLRRDVYDHIHHLPISYFDMVPAGSIVSRITNDTEIIRMDFYFGVFSDVLMQMVKIVGMFIAIYMVRWEIALFLFPLFPGILLFHRYYKKKTNDKILKVRQLQGAVNGRINEITKNVEMTQSFGMQEKVLDDFQKLTRRKRDMQLSVDKIYWRLFNVPESVMRLATFGAASWLLYTYFFQGSIVTPGLIYLVTEYVTALFSPVMYILDLLASISRSLVAAQRVFEVMDTPIEEEGIEGVPSVQGRVEARGIHFSYIEGTEVLKDVDFFAEQGKTIAIVGPTGSGKSSLVNLLFRYYDPQEGSVKIDGEDIREKRRQSLRRHMGIVLQEPFLVEGTLYENISLYNEAISKEEAERALRQVGGSDLLEQHEAGMDFLITERGKNLSTGQRQLISFARALAYNPRILILDEATASIDTQTEQMIQHAMQVVKKGRTTIMIAHRLSTIRDADCIYVLSEGRIREKGTHQELMEKQGIYADMVRIQEQML